jgi:hypothetical protein
MDNLTFYSKALDKNREIFLNRWGIKLSNNQI